VSDSFPGYDLNLRQCGTGSLIDGHPAPPQKARERPTKHTSITQSKKPKS